MLRSLTLETRAALLRDATEVMESEYFTEMTLDDVADRIATSRRQLQRSFAEVGDTTFREHVARVRMRKAAEMLEDPRVTVGQVARRVGYRQQAQFAKAFRRQYGAAPAEYRRGVTAS